MSNGIYLVGRGRVNAGKTEAAAAVMAKAIKHIRATNPGVVLYEHAIDPKTGAWTGIEKYANSEALKAHLMDAVVGEALGQFMQELAFEGITVMGDVSTEVQKMMAGFNPTYLGNSLGFARTGDAAVVERTR